MKTGRWQRQISGGLECQDEEHMWVVGAGSIQPLWNILEARGQKEHRLEKSRKRECSGNYSLQRSRDSLLPSSLCLHLEHTGANLVMSRILCGFSPQGSHCVARTKD